MHYALFLIDNVKCKSHISDIAAKPAGPDEDMPMIILSNLFRDPYLRRVFARAERDGGAIWTLAPPHPIRPAPGSDAAALKRPEV